MADILTRDAILAVRLRHEDVEVPEWGGTVRVWELSALRKLDFRPAKGESPEGAMVRLVAACVGDEHGPADLPVDRLSSGALQKLAAVAARINIATAEAREDLRGNSSGGPSGSLPSGSP
jgi:hypothetical protein